MSKTRHVTLLIMAQVACLGMGLWIHQSLVLSSLRHSADVASVAAMTSLLPRLTSTLWTANGITFVWCSALLSVVTHLVATRIHERSDSQDNLVVVEELKRASALMRTQEAVIFGLAKLADSRDSETGEHLERIALYSSTIASAARRHEDFREAITPSLVQWIGVSSALHDIGKVGIEDAILRKSGRLTTAERLRMQEHTKIGEQCLLEIERRLGQSNFLRMAREIVAAHHERWDGRGYPYQLSGEQIPLAARIVAIADVYDALSSKRVYKPAVPHDQCVDLIRSEAGGQFDPRLVEVFLEVEPLLKNIKQRLNTARVEPVPQECGVMPHAVSLATESPKSEAIA